MTRKEALTVAVQALSEDVHNAEAVEVLLAMREELPLNRWTEAAIRDAIEQFVLDHGRVPNGSDFKKDRCLPPHTVIKNRYGVNLSAWVVENYPDVVALQKKARAAATERFVSEYHRLKPRSAAEFDKGRSPDCCCWNTIARYNQTSTWRELLAKLELPVFSVVDVPEKKRAYYVQFDADMGWMEPRQRAALQQVVEEGQTYSAGSFKIVDEQEAPGKHFCLRFAAEVRFASEGEKGIQGKREI